ncbi:MAG: hypothetical protein B6D44_10230 [Ignavibacteriales bacterium UTCHB2]|jgi:DNA-binding response OmpR family regulator|nr:MAG: hypothetical protein B6D44_10230 [Ignavibacteriales bacterium UTCHB2]
MNKYQQPIILIVDDDETMCKLLCEQLKEEKFKAEFVLDGSDAVNIIKKKEFSLVILDQNMRIMNGDKALAEIKKYDSTLPVIMLSAQTDPAIIVKCIKLGADDYFPKPYEYDELIDSIIKYIRIKK